MANKIISKKAFEGNVYNLGNKDRVVASVDPVKYAIVKHDGNVVGGAPWVQDSEVVTQWTQPANTWIKSVQLFVTAAPTTAASISLGWEVGHTSSGAEVCTGDITDGIIDAGTDGTDLAQYALARCITAQGALDAVTLAADGSYAASSRTLYFTTAASDHAVTTAGTVQWWIEYVDLNDISVKEGAL